jgi:hypothetical protein
MATYDPTRSRPQTAAAAQVDALLPQDLDAAGPDPQGSPIGDGATDGVATDEKTTQQKTAHGTPANDPLPRAVEPVIVPTGRDGQRLRLLIAGGLALLGVAAAGLWLRRVSQGRSTNSARRDNSP